MKKVLITGGAGFVGRRFCKRCLDLGYEVHCVDSIEDKTGGILPENWPLFNPLDYDNFKFFKEDCRDYFKRVNEYYDYVFHLAAMVGGRIMIEWHPLAVAEDLAIDAMYWQWAKKNKPKKTVYFSSSAAYPIKYQFRENYCLLSEDMIAFDTDIGMPDLTYGWAKLTGEYLARLAYQMHGIESAVYRPFSGYGEDQDMTYPFPSICQRALDNIGAKTLDVWGTGQQIRDFIYIEDCVTGVMSTMDKVNDGDALNLSTGINTSFTDFVRTATGLLGYSPTINPLSDKPEGCFARAGDTKKQAEFGFKYTVPFEEGIKKALKYLEEKKK